MDENEIKAKLDLLAEFHAKRDMLEFEKRKLLEENKVPEYVQAIVKQSMQEMGKVESSFAPTLKAIQEETDLQLSKIVVPDEIKAALAEIDHQRALANAYRIAKEKEISERIQAIKAEVQANAESQTKAVYDAIEARKHDIEAEFSGKNEAADTNIKALEAEIKAAVKELKCSVKASHFNAVYVSGRITWNTDKMEAWRVAYPFLNDARKEGEPSITLRRI